jgi:hypothetical protein
LYKFGLEFGFAHGVLILQFEPIKAIFASILLQELAIGGSLLGIGDEVVNLSIHLLLILLDALLQVLEDAAVLFLSVLQLQPRFLIKADLLEELVKVISIGGSMAYAVKCGCELLVCIQTG